MLTCRGERQEEVKSFKLTENWTAQWGGKEGQRGRTKRLGSPPQLQVSRGDEEEEQELNWSDHVAADVLNFSSDAVTQ